MTLYNVSSCTVSPQNELLNVLVTQMPGQKTLNIGSSCKVSHLYELLYVFSISISCQMTWNTGCNGGVWSACSLLPTVDETGLNLCSARHPLLPLICLESERSLSAHPPALLLYLIHLKHLLPPRKCRTGITSASKGPEGVFTELLFPA